MSEGEPAGGGANVSAYRHSGKAIVTYYDGHTEMKSIEDIRALDRKGGKNNIFWGGDQQ